MYKKLKYTMLILCSLICVHSFFFNKLYAMTQKEIGEAIATFALNFQKAPDGGQTWTYDYNAANRAQAYRGQRHADGTFHADCVGWVSMCLHLSIGMDSPAVSSGLNGFVVPNKYKQNYEGFGFVIEDVTGQALMPGDVLQNSHHVMIYVGKINGEDTIIHSHKNGSLGYDTFASYSSWNWSAAGDINGTYLHAYRVSESHAATVDKSQVNTTWNGSGGDYSFEGGSSGSTTSGGGSNLENFEGNPNFKPDEDDKKKDYRLVSPNDKLPIYKHILFTEKYNFNNIKWKRYGHGYEGIASTTQVDLELGLKYPKDDQNTKLGKFVSLVLPYIQTWYIPLAMYSGILNSKGGNMNYGGEIGGEANYSGADNVEKVWNFLNSKGLPTLQVAAIMGNIACEAGLDFSPSAIEVGNGNAGFGLCQWSYDRRERIVAYAAAQNKEPDDITLQLDFLWLELSGEDPNIPNQMQGGSFEEFCSITDLDEATIYICDKFERPRESLAHKGTRIQQAHMYYDAYNSMSSESSSSSSTSSSDKNTSDKGKDSDIKKSKRTKNVNFPYSIIKNGYHEIIVNRYDMQTYTLSTKYKEYMEYKRRSVGTIRKKTITTVDSTGKTLSETTKVYVVDCKPSEEVSKKPVNTRKKSDGSIDPMLEDFVGSSTNINTKYYLYRALTFDMLYTNNFNYTKYKDEDAQARINADSENIANRVEYKETLDEENRFSASDMKGDSVQEIAASVNGTSKRTNLKRSVTKSKSGDKTITTTSIEETYTITGKLYTYNDGEEIYIDRKWEDKLSQGSSDSKQLDYDEMIKYNENEDKNSNRDSITKEEFEKGKAQEYRKYRVMGKKGTINLIDFMNSNPKLYKTYLNKGAERSKYMGYVKEDDLLMSYHILKKLIEKTKGDSKTVPYAYFTSLGFKMGYSNTTEIENGTSSNSGGFGWPVDLTNNDGARVINCIFPYTAGYGGSHGAIDIAPGDGANIIIAAKDGKVSKILKGNSGYGNSILIEHDGGYYTRYSHLSSINSSITEGIEVKKGQALGYMGSTGNSTGKHLDFEIYKDGTASSNRIDPLDFYNTEPEYGSIDPKTIVKMPSGYKFASEKSGGSGSTSTGLVAGKRNILVIAGHSSYPKDARSRHTSGYHETEETRKVAQILSNSINNAGMNAVIANRVLAGNKDYTDKEGIIWGDHSLYAERCKQGKGVYNQFKGYDYAIEIHFNAVGGSLSGSASGTEIVLLEGTQPTSLNNKLIDTVVKYNLGNKRRNPSKQPIADISGLKSVGVDMSYIEVEFYDNKQAMDHISANYEKMCDDIAQVLKNELK